MTETFFTYFYKKSTICRSLRNMYQMFKASSWSGQVSYFLILLTIICYGLYFLKCINTIQRFKTMLIYQQSPKYK